MTRKLPAQAATLITLYLATGCGNTPADRPVVNEPPPETEACATEKLLAPEVELAALDRARCEKQMECGVPLVSQTTEVEACIAALQSAKTAELLSARDVGPSARNACLCRESYKNDSCGSLRARPAAECGQVMVGPSALGEACSLDFDCREGLVCDLRAMCPGSCVTPPPRCTEGSCAADEFCDGATALCRPRRLAGEECTGAACESGYFCGYDVAVPIAGPSTCVRVPAVNEPCISAEGSCPVGYSCQGNAEGTANVCRLNLALDANCVSYDQCAAGLYCDFDNGSTCRPQATLGETCRNIGRNCGDGLECKFPPSYACAPDRACGLGKECCNVGGEVMCAEPFGECGSLEGTCGPLTSSAEYEIRLLEPGADCSNGDCPLGTVCRKASPSDLVLTCAPLLALGAPCRDELGIFDLYGCESGICDLFGSGRCVETKFPGAECSWTGFTFECASLHCEGGTCSDWDGLCTSR